MVRVEIETNQAGLIRRVEVSGHAGYSEKGFDIVCASVTTLVRSAARILEQDDHSPALENLYRTLTDKLFRETKPKHGRMKIGEDI